MNETERRLRVLVVDDSIVDARLMRHWMQKWSPPADVQHVKTGTSALELLNRKDDGDQSRFDLVLIDVQLPGINGLETYQRLREIPELTSVPIVVLSGTESERETNAVKHDNRAWFRLKPFDATEFQKLFEELHRLIQS